MAAGPRFLQFDRWVLRTAVEMHMIVEADRHALKPKPLRIIIRNGCGTSRLAV